ncbi:MAG: hypothetical protein P8J87_10070, partial [Verrucomicrobiales bacterium]|nr:hypothetical protein [Verrucomicrobiales bacterium]
EAILRVCLSRKTEELRAAPLLVELPKADNPALKGQIMYMLGRVGGERALEAIEKEIAGGDKDIQDAGIRALAEWPTTEPAELLFGLAENGKDIYRKAVALLAFNQVVSYGSDKPMGVRVGMLERSLEFARANEVPKVEVDVFRKLPGFFAPEALELAKENEGDEELGRFAKSAVPAIERGLDRLLEIAEVGGKIEAVRGVTAGDGIEYQSREGGGVIGDWESEQATVTWLVRFLKEGTYVVKLDGAATAAMGGTVSVELAGSQLQGVVEKTGGEEVFTSTKVGEVTIVEPGAYQLTVGAKKIEGEYLMLLRSIELEAKQ